MEITIEKLIFEGFGLGKDLSFDSAQDCAKRKKPIFVRKSVPGDVLDVEIIKDKKSYAEAKINKIIKPSTLRVEPLCPYFNKCGGCEHQNIAYKDQLKLKGEIFEETLKRQGIKIKPEPIIAGSEEPLYYRNSIRFFFLLDKNNQISFGRHNYLYESGYVEVNKCLLQSEIANEVLSKLQNFINQNIEHKRSLWQLKIREGKFTGELMIEIITDSEHLPEQAGIVQTLSAISGVKSIYHTIAPAKSLKNLKRRLIFGSPIIFEKVGKYRFQISPESFFQTNSLGVETLYNKIKEFANLKIGESVLDLYCGTGTIGIFLSTLAKEVVGIEIVPEAIRDAKDNAKINHLHNCRFINSDAKKIFNDPVIRDSKFDILILDPPRAGLTKELINKLSAVSRKRIIYVSCNPATFARDIKLLEGNGLSLKKVQPIDMFPQTHHIECIGLIVR